MNTQQNTLFENLPELIRPKTLSSVLGISVKTIYDWRYRGQDRGIPQDMFVKINNVLYINSNALRRWVAAQNPYF